MYKYGVEGNILVIHLDGVIDSTNATEVENEISDIINKSSFEYLLFDCMELKYISSAGLRIVLKIFRNHKKMEMVNLSNEVYDIFDMTGFSKMITVRKIFREVNIDEAEKIGHGAKGDIYKFKNDLIVKVYKAKNPIAEIQKEIEYAKTAFLLGVPTAISYDVCKVGEGYGTVFELISAKSVSTILIEEPSRLKEMAQKFATVLKDINSIDASMVSLPDANNRLFRWLNMIKDSIPEDVYDRIEKLIKTIPDSKKLIHGDYHTSNVMIQNGEPILIDMDTLSCGDKIVELGIVDFSYSSLNEYDPMNTMCFLGIDKDTASSFYKEVFNTYFSELDEAERDINAKKIKFVAMLRVINHFRKREDKENIDKSLNDLLVLMNEIDDLVLI